MIVIAVKDKGKIIKGARYTVEYIWNNGKNSFNEGEIKIAGFHSLPVELFTLEDGSPIPNINYNCYDFDESTLRKGDLIICESNRYKNFVRGGIYKIEKIKSNKRTDSYMNWTDYYVKFEGYSRYIRYNNWSFRKVPTDQLREMTLDTILNNKSIDTKVNTSIRKIDKISDKNDTLIKLLSKSILDPKRKLNPLDWLCDKMNNNFSVNREDYDKLMNMTLREILEIVKHN